MKRLSCCAKDHGTKLIGVQRRLCSVAGGVRAECCPGNDPQARSKKLKRVKAARRARCGGPHRPRKQAPCFLQVHTVMWFNYAALTFGRLVIWLLRSHLVVT